MSYRIVLWKETKTYTTWREHGLNPRGMSILLSSRKITQKLHECWTLKKPIVDWQFKDFDYEFLLCVLISLCILIFIWVFFHKHSRFTGQQGKKEGIFLTPFYHFHPLHRNLDISRAITAESSLLHIASSRTPTGNLGFLSASRKSLNCFHGRRKSKVSVCFFVIFQNVSSEINVKGQNEPR